MEAVPPGRPSLLGVLLQALRLSALVSRGIGGMGGVHAHHSLPATWSLSCACPLELGDLLSASGSTKPRPLPPAQSWDFLCPGVMSQGAGWSGASMCRSYPILKKKYASANGWGHMSNSQSLTG